MHTISESHCPFARRAARLRRKTLLRHRVEQKLRASDLLVTIAEIGSAIAACGLLHWVVN